MCGRVSFDARRANFFFRPLFGFEFDFDPAPATACASIPSPRYARYLKCASRAWWAGVYIRPPRAVHAHASAPSRLHARPRTAVRSGGRARLRRRPTPVEGWRQAQLWRYVGAGRTSAHNTCFLSLRARASRLRKHLTAPLRVRHLETSDDHDDERRGRVECRWSSTALAGIGNRTRPA